MYIRCFGRYWILYDAISKMIFRWKLSFCSESISYGLCTRLQAQWDRELIEQFLSYLISFIRFHVPCTISNSWMAHRLWTVFRAFKYMCVVVGECAYTYTHSHNYYFILDEYRSKNSITINVVQYRWSCCHLFYLSSFSHYPTCPSYHSRQVAICEDFSCFSNRLNARIESLTLLLHIFQLFVIWLYLISMRYGEVGY